MHVYSLRSLFLFGDTARPQVSFLVGNWVRGDPEHAQLNRGLMESERNGSYTL